MSFGIFFFAIAADIVQFL